MAFKQEYIDRYKATGFYRHVEWNRQWGVLIKVYEKRPGEAKTAISFQTGVFDLDFEQKFLDEGFKAFFVTRIDAVQFMVNIGLPVAEIAQTFRRIDGKQEVHVHV